MVLYIWSSVVTQYICVIQLEIKLSYTQCNILLAATNALKPLSGFGFRQRKTPMRRLVLIWDRMPHIFTPCSYSPKPIDMYKLIKEPTSVAKGLHHPHWYVCCWLYEAHRFINSHIMNCNPWWKHNSCSMVENLYE